MLIISLVSFTSCSYELPHRCFSLSAAINCTRRRILFHISVRFLQLYNLHPVFWQFQEVKGLRTSVLLNGSSGEDSEVLNFLKIISISSMMPLMKYVFSSSGLSFINGKTAIDFSSALLIWTVWNKKNPRIIN